MYSPDPVKVLWQIPRRDFTVKAQGWRSNASTNPVGVTPGGNRNRADEWNPHRVRAAFGIVTQGRPLRGANPGL